MKIKIKNRGFPTTHYGYLEAGKEYEVSDAFGKYCVENMQAADHIKVTRKRVIKKRVIKENANNSRG